MTIAAKGVNSLTEMSKSRTLNNAKIVDPEKMAVFEGGVVIENGVISEIFEGQRDREGALDLGGHFLAPGIVDIGVKIGEPGARHTESFKTASAAALAGGVTSLLMRPDTSPAIDSPETLAFVKARATETAHINVLLSGAITAQRLGLEMAEIGFMRDAGAIAFSDGDHVILDSKIALRAYSYIAQMGGLIIGHVQEPYLSKGAVANASSFATKQGLSGVSPLAEKIGLQREMALVEMTGVDFHVDQITTAAALPVLGRAKDAGLNVSAGTSIHHLTLNELDIGDFRTFFKLKPPLRSEGDRRAIIEAVKSGLIDCISSMHTPQDEESKRLPFEDAAAGAIGLEMLLPAALRLFHAEDLTLPEIFRALSLNPARRLGLNAGKIEKGAQADFVVFDTQTPWIVDRFKLRSKAKNTPFDESKMQGRVLATIISGETRFQLEGAFP